MSFFFFFFFNDTATTEIYTLSLHDALPILPARRQEGEELRRLVDRMGQPRRGADRRSEEHTSELQSQSNLVCRLLLEKKKKKEEKHAFLRIQIISERLAQTLYNTSTRICSA